MKINTFYRAIRNFMIAHKFEIISSTAFDKSVDILIHDNEILISMKASKAREIGKELIRVADIAEKIQ